MKRTAFGIAMIVLLFMQIVAVSALTAGEAKQAWYESKSISIEKQAEHNKAKAEWAADKTLEKEQAVVDTGKAVLDAALDEAEAWLTWVNLEAEENPEVPEDIKQSIQDDVEANLAKIVGLRTDVDSIQTRIDLGVVFIKMVGKYLELLSDVARNTGKMWGHIGNLRIETAEEYEAILREQAGGVQDNEEIIAKLDLAKSELEIAKQNVENAEAEYEQVRIPGMPIIKFANGNNYLNIAKGNLLSAHSYLNQAFMLMASRGE